MDSQKIIYFIVAFCSYHCPDLSLTSFDKLLCFHERQVTHIEVAYSLRKKTDQCCHVKNLLDLVQTIYDMSVAIDVFSGLFLLCSVTLSKT